MSRIRVAKLEDVGIDHAIACVSCLEKPCLECPTEALSVGSLGTIDLDHALCNGCETCVESCPVGAVGFYGTEPLFCDLCDGEVTCIEACPTGALSDRDAGISLAGFLDLQGNVGEKRRRFVEVLAQPVREAWKAGARADS